MADITCTDFAQLEAAVDPNSRLYQELMDKLLKPVREDTSRPDKLKRKAEWKPTLPFRTDPEMEVQITTMLPFRFADRGIYRNGGRSLASTMDALIDCVSQSSGRNRTTPTLVMSAEYEMLVDTLATGGTMSTLVQYCGYTSLYDQLAAVRPTVMIVDHTTINVPIDELLNLAFKAGVEIVDGVFPYHVAGVRGWDTVAGFGDWSYTHTAGYVTIGPDDDPSRLMRYTREQYRKFTEPALWKGKCRQYFYEIRRYQHGLATYRAVYVGDVVPLDADADISFKLPTCSSDDMVLITINKQLAAGVFASHSTNAYEISALDKDYAIEVRKDLFNPCIEYLIGQAKGSDIAGDAIRYITQHNYVDLQDGVRVIRRHSLRYADALCVAMVCALVAFQLRYRLTNESLPVIQREVKDAGWRASAPLGALGRMVYLMGRYVTDKAESVFKRVDDVALNLLHNSDYIPGVCYDVYVDRYYRPHADWFEAWNPVVDVPDVPGLNLDEDPFAHFMGFSERAYAPNVRKERTRSKLLLDREKYKHVTIADPAYVLQSVYDELFPGNSVAQLQNVSELKRVRDVNINTEFYGKIQIGKDIAAPERLHDDAPIRTAALPVSRTSLLDAMLASAKRNWNPPDMQMESNVWVYAEHLVDKFIEFAFVPGYSETIGPSYQRDRVSFNVTDYMAWKAGKDGNYRKMLEDECPADMVYLELERFDTIIKKRVKPKLSTAAQQEIGQGQVIVGMSKKDTALFTSVFRVMFERFDHALRPEICSAGRLSDMDISEWVTDHLSILRSMEAIEMDSGKYDKSQNLLARMIESVMFRRLGLDPNVMEIFEDSYVGRVSSKILGIMFMSAYQMKSGAPDTMLGNLIYNFVSAVESVGPQNIAAMIAKGDDNVIWLRHGIKADVAVEKMAKLFNLESKLITGSVLYFSSGFILLFEEFGYFVPDIAKAIELLGEIGMDPRTKPERWVSFRDRVSIYAAYVGLPDAIQAAVRSRYDRPGVDIVAAIDALLTAADSYETYDRITD
ncbi:P2 protein [Aspergillus lentulus jivivirus 1]|nr:P2 protein [Aspergillus lentulus jivivirus 1]